MKKQNKILTAFLLNFFFAVFEFIGGIISGSVAISSDALHDFGDALSIFAAYFLEKLSRKEPNGRYTYGYIRYSVLGSVLSALILLLGAVIIIIRAVKRIAAPVSINYNEMLVFAVVGFLVNLTATVITSEKGSLNMKAVNLHMLEDALGWAAVLAGAIVMRFTDFIIIDPILSIAISLFIGINAIKALKETLNIFLMKVPDSVSVNEIEKHLLEIEGVNEIHHLHISSLDGCRHTASLHAVIEGNAAKIKDKIRCELAEHSIIHAVIETEYENDNCSFRECTAYKDSLNAAALHSHHHNACS